MSTEDLLANAPLRYSTDTKPGYTREIKDKKFIYFDQHGKKITDEKVVERINKLAIPPAYTNVWICPYKNGYLQAIGYDAKHRKQYRYHPLWNEISQKEKFGHVIEFAKHLPTIRTHITDDLARQDLPREKILAAIVWLLEHTLIRVGNEEYEKDNKSYGLTTLKNRHVRLKEANNIVFQFKGKSGVHHTVTFHNKRVATIIRKCKELPGQDLFEYLDGDKNIQSISSSDVNTYLKEISGAEITAKDFRTWGGTVMAATAFDLCDTKDERDIKKNTIETIKKVAKHLRNKPNTSKKYYIHPYIIAAYAKGLTLSKVNKHKTMEGLDECENKVVSLLKQMKREEEKIIHHMQKNKNNFL
ncbi:MAG: DNA topoisomerase IB [Candidatus Levyibacteriota bacterium]